MGGERRRGGFHRAQTGGCQSRSAHTVPRACPASASPECPPSGLNSAAHARFSACKTQEGRDGAVGSGVAEREGLQDGHGAWHCPPTGRTIPAERRERAGTGRPGQGQPTRPGPPAHGGRGMEGAHGTQMGWGLGGTTELKTEPKKGRKNQTKQNPQMSLDTKIKNNVWTPGELTFFWLTFFFVFRPCRDLWSCQ